MEEISYFMVGMPSGGKTSYIIRLCSQIIREKNTVYRLADGRLPEGLSNIEEQMDKMDSFQKIMRTFENVCYEVRLPLVNEEGERILIRIPDLSGEHYRKLVEERYIARNIYEGLQQSDEILFFINTETMEKEERLNYDEMSAARMIEESFREEEGNLSLIHIWIRSGSREAIRIVRRWTLSGRRRESRILSTASGNTGGHIIL